MPDVRARWLERAPTIVSIQIAHPTGRMLILRGKSSDPPLTESPTSSATTAPAYSNGEPPAVRLPKTGTMKDRVLLYMAAVQRPLHKSTIARGTGLGIEQVTFRLVDLKRKEGLVDSDGQGVWSLTDDGRNEARRLAGTFGIHSAEEVAAE